MPAIVTCVYRGMEIPVEEALAIRKRQGKVSRGTFQCTECGQPLRVHRAGKSSHPAHFEHFQRNPECPLSHRLKERSTHKYYGIDDKAAVEGYLQDRQVRTRYRNQNLAAQCKARDKYTCQACGFYLVLNDGRHVVECHHIVMLAEGQREVALDEVVTLCPTCHRIAHTRSKPYSAEEIKGLLTVESVADLI